MWRCTKKLIVADGILIKADIPESKLSLENTYRDMATIKEDWSDWNTAVADGIEPKLQLSAIKIIT